MNKYKYLNEWTFDRSYDHTTHDTDMNHTAYIGHDDDCDPLNGIKDDENLVQVSRQSTNESEMTFKRAPHFIFLLLYYSTTRSVPFVVVFPISYNLHTSLLTFLAHSHIHLSTIRAALDVTITAAALSGGAWDETIARSSRVVYVVVLWFHRYTMTSDGCSMRLVGSCKHSHRLGYSRDLCDTCLCTFFIRAYHNVQWICFAAMRSGWWALKSPHT